MTAALVVLLAGRVEAQETTAADIVRNPNAYSNRMVTVRGIMMNLRPDTTFGPTRATGVVFDLAAGPASSWSAPSCRRRARWAPP